MSPPPGVAPPGQRLKRGFPWAAVSLAAIIAAVVFVPNVITFFIALFATGR